MIAKNYPLSHAVRMITLDVRITGLRRGRARIWLGVWAIRAAAAIIGCGVNISVDVEQGARDAAR